TPLVLDLDSLLQVVTASLKTDLRVASRRDRIEDGLHVVTGMDHESALTRFIAAAQVIECFLNVLCLAEVADGVVETDVDGADLSQRWKRFATIFNVTQHAAVRLDEGETAIVMLDALRRLRFWTTAVFRPLDLAGGSARRNQPVIAGVIGACREIDLNAAFEIDPRSEVRIETG